MEEYQRTENQRIGEVLDYMVENLKIAPSRKALAKVLGLSESLVSLVANDRQGISKKFLDAIARTAPMVNRDWIKTGEGNMIEENYSATTSAEDPTIRRQQELIAAANDTLNTMLQNGMGENIIMRQLDMIASLQKTLESMEAKSTMQGSIIINSDIDSFRDNAQSLNGSFNGSPKRRGRKTNASKARKQDNQDEQ